MKLLVFRSRDAQAEKEIASSKVGGKHLVSSLTDDIDCGGGVCEGELVAKTLLIWAKANREDGLPRLYERTTGKRSGNSSSGQERKKGKKPGGAPVGKLGS